MSSDSRNSYSSELPNLEEVKSKGSLFAKGQGHYEVKVISIPDETKITVVKAQLSLGQGQKIST